VQRSLDARRRFRRRLRVGADGADACGLRARRTVRQHRGQARPLEGVEGGAASMSLGASNEGSVSAHTCRTRTRRPPRGRRLEHNLDVHPRVRRRLRVGTDLSYACGLRARRAGRDVAASRVSSRAACAARPRGASAPPSATPCRRGPAGRLRAAGSVSSASTSRTSKASSRAARAAQPRSTLRRRLRVGADRSDASGLRARRAARRRRDERGLLEGGVCSSASIYASLAAPCRRGPVRRLRTAGSESSASTSRRVWPPRGRRAQRGLDVHQRFRRRSWAGASTSDLRRLRAQ
jgi:hypothetical protein